MIVVKRMTIPSKLSSAFFSLLFCVYICGHQRRRRTASNSVDLSLFHANHWHRCDPIFCSCHSTHSSGSRCPFSSCSLLLPLSQPHSIGISQDSVVFRSEVPVLILNILHMRTPEYDLKTNLDSVEFPLYSRGLSSSNVFPHTSTIQPDPPQLFRHAFRIQTTSHASLPCVMK